LLAERSNLEIIAIARARNGNHKRRAIELIPEIDSNGAHRSLISHSESDGVGEVIQFVGAIRYAHRHVRWPCGKRWILQRKCGRRQSRAERDSAEPAVHIAAVIENRPAERCPDERQAHRKTEFLVEDENGLATDWEAGAEIARPGLIEREASQ